MVSVLLCGANVTDQTIKTIASILAKGDRVELILTQDGIKVVRIRRENVKV